MEAGNLIVNGDAIFNGRIYGLKLSDLTWKTKPSTTSGQYYKIGCVDLGTRYESFSGIYNVNVVGVGIVQVNLSVIKDIEATARIIVYTESLQDKFEFILEPNGSVYNFWIKVEVADVICMFQSVCEASRSISGDEDNGLSIQVNDDDIWVGSSPSIDDNPIPSIKPGPGDAEKLAEARTINITGAVTGSVEFDGSEDVTINTAVNHNHDDDYSIKGHNHDNTYAAKDHAHDNTYAAKNHSHNYAGSSSDGGSATSADKATKDGNDNDIASTYVKDISISGRTVTVTRGDDTTFTQTTQDNNTVTNVKGNAETTYRSGNVNLTPANLGALALSGGTMTGALVAQANTSYTTAQVRNITMSTADPSGGTNGQIHFKYT